MAPITTIGAIDDLIMRFEDLSSRLLDTFPVIGSNPPAILITSARPGEGKTTVSLAMARAMALASGEPILLVDANLHKPGLAKTLKLDPASGLADALRSPDDDMLIQKHGIAEGLSAVCAGNDPAPRLLGRAKAVRYFREQHTRAFRFVIFDGAENRLGGAALSKHVDGVLLTIDASTTRREVVNAAINDIRLHNGKLLGSILNKRSHYIPSFLYKNL
ncbi:MAG: hypothetical protein ACU836_07300 [Gammaproteobacteria bacterium]